MAAQSVLIAGKQVTITGKSADYFGTRRISKDMGGRPISSALDDKALVGPDALAPNIKIYHRWNDEIVSHPEKGGKFQRGKDIIDSQTRWLLLASDVSRLAPEAFDEPGLYLYIKPTQVIVDKGRTIVQPETIKVVRNVVQTSGEGGKADEETRLPLQVAKEVWDALSDDDKRWLYRIQGVAVRPMVRDSFCARSIKANIPPSVRFAVLVEGATMQAP